MVKLMDDGLDHCEEQPVTVIGCFGVTSTVNGFYFDTHGFTTLLSPNEGEEEGGKVPRELLFVFVPLAGTLVVKVIKFVDLGVSIGKRASRGVKFGLGSGVQEKRGEEILWKREMLLDVVRMYRLKRFLVLWAGRPLSVTLENMPVHCGCITFEENALRKR